ncbi:arginine N-succinyltransferase [Thermodesulfobacteriota bacterium B35]
MTREQRNKGFSGLQVTAIVAATVVVTLLAGFFVLRAWLFPAPFRPVVLNRAEEQRLEMKLQRIESVAEPSAHGKAPAAGPGQEQSTTGVLRPEPYSEEGASREIELTERELNALLAKNTNLADRMAIDLAEDLVSARLLIPVDPDFPILGGKTVRVRAGVELAYRDGRPVVRLRGVSVMGVPVPNAWLGNMKNIDLVREFGSTQGFWKTFADGVESITVREGKLHIRLKE